jgi:hypothetical protein
VCCMLPGWKLTHEHGRGRSQNPLETVSAGTLIDYRFDSIRRLTPLSWTPAAGCGLPQPRSIYVDLDGHHRRATCRPRQLRGVAQPSSLGRWATRCAGGSWSCWPPRNCVSPTWPRTWAPRSRWSAITSRPCAPPSPAPSKPCTRSSAASTRWRPSNGSWTSRSTACRAPGWSTHPPVRPPLLPRAATRPRPSPRSHRA